MRAGNSQGFSLLELMVVVALVGLIAAMVVPTLTGPDTDSLDDAADSIRGHLAAVADRSLMRGELLAVRLERQRLELLRYDFREQAFVPLEDAGKAEIRLEEPLFIEWQFGDDGEGEPALADVVESRLEDKAGKRFGSGKQRSGTVPEGDAGDEEDESKETFPQLFFFPSGEATPTTLWIRDSEADREITLKLDSLGRLERPDRQAQEADES